jgi:type IV secretion system protein VirD4
VRAGIVLGLGTRLQILQNEAIRRITDHSDIDLTEPGRSKCAYFVILSDQESSAEFLSSLFFSFLFIRLTRYADGMPERRCKVPVNIVFEELNNVGRLDSYPRRLSVARSRDIRICHVVQSLAQFKNRYPFDEWAEIIGNCDTQLMLGVTEKDGAEFFSVRSGESTVRVNSTMSVKRTIAPIQLIPQYRETDGLGRRQLLTPDEILRLPNDELLIMLRGENVLRAKKFDYTGHPCAKKLLRSSIFDYAPQPASFQPAPPQTGPERCDESGKPPEPRLFATAKSISPQLRQPIALGEEPPDAF